MAGRGGRGDGVKDVSSRKKGTIDTITKNASDAIWPLYGWAERDWLTLLAARLWRASQAGQKMV